LGELTDLMATNNRMIEAFKESFNTVGLATAVALSAATLNPLPLLAAIVFEAGYLLFVPDSRWYQARLSERYDKEVIERRKKLKDQVFPTLSHDIRNRFGRLEIVRDQINNQEFAGKHWFREVLRKLDYLLEKFLLFASKEVQFEGYLNSVLLEVNPAAVTPPPKLEDGGYKPVKRRKPTDEDDEPARQSYGLATQDEWVKQTVSRIQTAYAEEITNIDNLMQRDDNLHNQAVLEKRKEVLSRRAQYVARIGEILTNLTHQLHLMEDTFGLINDEIRARSPEQVLADIEDVVFQTDTLTETLQEVSPFDQMTLAPGAGKLYDVTEEKQR
jgi:hypothetical protein